jgi:hypothetical protein
MPQQPRRNLRRPSMSAGNHFALRLQNAGFAVDDAPIFEPFNAKHDATGARALVPASPSIEAAAAKQKHDDDDEENSCHIHDGAPLARRSAT